MKAPGSPSSALQTMYFCAPAALRAICHFLPVGKPPPPLPRRPLARISSTTSCRVMVVIAFCTAE